MTYFSQILSDCCQITYSYRELSIWRISCYLLFL